VEFRTSFITLSGCWFQRGFGIDAEARFVKQWQYITDVPATVSAVAALLGTFAASGGFERKWRANRISRGKIEELRIDLTADSADAKAVRERFKAIIEAQGQAIAGISK